MIKFVYDPQLRALVLDYAGPIDAAQVWQLYSDLQKAVPQYGQGFRVLSDFSSVRAVSPDIREPLKKIMDFLNAQGVSEIIRIIPDPEHDIGFNILSLFHYSKSVSFLTVSSRQEAESRLAVWRAKRKIAFVEMKEAWQRDYIKSRFPGEDIRFFEETAQERIAELRDVNALCVFVQSRVERGHIEQMPELRCILTRSTGFDHIDLQAAGERSIEVCNVPTYGENTVAEHTFALILSLSRNLRKAYLRTVRDDFSLEGLMGFDLKGKTLGVIGTGHIGLHVARIAAGFGMRVLAFDVRQQGFLSEVLNFEYVPLEELLAESDIISLHAPHLPSTHHLINKKNIGLIKKGAVLINTARGGLVETEALIEALDKEILSGAGLDVLEDETIPPEQQKATLGLLHRDNVIFTPHMAFYSREAVQRILETTAGNLHAFLRGGAENAVGVAA